MSIWTEWGWCIYEGSDRATLCECLRREFPGEPDAGKLHVRFDEGGVGRNTWHAANEPQRENPVTDVCRSLNIVTYSSTLPRERFCSFSLPFPSLCRIPTEELDSFHHENSTVLHLLALVGNWIGRHRVCDRPSDRATHGCNLLDFDRHRNLLRRWSNLARTPIQQPSRQRIIAINAASLCALRGLSGENLCSSLLHGPQR